MAGLTQAQLARRSGTSQAAIARYESGDSNPSTATLQRITRAAGFEVQLKLVAVKASDLSSNRAAKLRKQRGKINSLLSEAGASNPLFRLVILQNSPAGASNVLKVFRAKS